MDFVGDVLPLVGADVPLNRLQSCPMSVVALPEGGTTACVHRVRAPGPERSNHG